MIILAILVAAYLNRMVFSGCTVQMHPYWLKALRNLLNGQQYAYRCFNLQRAEVERMQSKDAVTAWGSARCLCRS